MDSVLFSGSIIIATSDLRTVFVRDSSPSHCNNVSRKVVTGLTGFRNHVTTACEQVSFDRISDLEGDKGCIFFIPRKSINRATKSAPFLCWKISKWRKYNIFSLEKNFQTFKIRCHSRQNFAFGHRAGTVPGAPACKSRTFYLRMTARTIYFLGATTTSSSAGSTSVCRQSSSVSFLPNKV